MIFESGLTDVVSCEQVRANISGDFSGRNGPIWSAAHDHKKGDVCVEVIHN